MAHASPPRAIPSWQPGRFVWPVGARKLVLLGGIGSRTGDAERAFAGLLRFLASQGGYDPRRDVLEATYAGLDAAPGWQPLPYAPPDTRRPLLDSAEAVAGSLDWYRRRLPDDVRLWVLGYSLGGVVGLDGATLAVARDQAGWRGRLGGVVTIAAPVRGCDAGPFMNWAWLVTAEPDPLGAAGRDLDARWTNPAERARVERRAAFLRDAGAAVLTLADPDDAVVRPGEALLPAPGQSPDSLLVPTTRSRPGAFGHGAVLDEPALWRRVLATVGPQSAADGDAAVADPIQQELDALKARLRAEGRLKG